MPLLWMFFSIVAPQLVQGKEKASKEEAFLNSRSFIHSVELLLTEFRKDLEADVFKKPMVSLLTSYSQSSNLSDEFRTHIIGRIVGNALAAGGGYKMVKCMECLTVRMELVNEDVVLKKGVITREENEALLKKYGATGWTEVNVSQIGSSLLLHVAIFSASGENVFSKEYQKPVYQIRDAGAIFSLSLNYASTSKASVGGLMGGRMSLGQRIPRFGDVGLFGASYMSTTIREPLSIFGLMFDLDINDIFQKYWTIGSLLFTNDIGVAVHNKSSQLHYGPGLKFKFGSLFHIQASYDLFKGFPSAKEKAADTEATPKSDVIITPSQTLPSMFVLGFGFDLG